ncbi:MAG: AbrB/MazE/SpoVT family DNA-binding domain-containing protein [Burkholderiaceae bacterium]
MTDTAKLSTRFRIAIPKAVCEQHWHAGQELAFIPKEGGVLIVAVPDFEQLAGIARGADPSGYRDRDGR